MNKTEMQNRNFVLWWYSMSTLRNPVVGGEKKIMLRNQGEEGSCGIGFEVMTILF